MHLAVLGSTTSWYLRDLARAAAGRHTIVPITFRSLAAASAPVRVQATAGNEPLSLAAVDAVLVRTMPPGSLEQVVFRMDVLGELERAGKVVINPPKAVETAVDKFLTTARLAAAGLNVPATFTCQDVNDAMAAFEELGGDVVLKPLFGSEGRGIARLNDEAVARRTFSLLAPLGAVLYLQKFIPHEGFDVRVLLVGEKPWGMRRRNELDWRTNVSRGAVAEPMDLSDDLVDLARRAAAVVGAPLAGVDLLTGRDGQTYVLEVNAVPGWQALSHTLKVDIAAEVLAFIDRRVNAAR